MSDEKMSVFKFTLSSGKEVYLREPRIGDDEHASRVAGNIAGPENTAHLGVLFQKEMIKLLLVQIGQSKLSLEEKQQLDKHFTYKEYKEVTKAIMMIVGDDQGNPELAPEIVSL